MKIHDSRFTIHALNEKGIALVMVLILAMISLAIVSAMLFMITQGTVLSGAQKFYSTAEEASTGAAELSVLYLSRRGIFTLAGAKGDPLRTGTYNVDFDSGCNCGDPMVTTDNNDLKAGGTMVPFSQVRTCRCDKLCNATAEWAASGVAWSCDDDNAIVGLQVDLSAKTNPDFTFQIGNFTLYSKIVDTVRGNSDLGTIVASGEIGGSAVSSGAAGLITPPHSPYLYRMEVQSEATTNPRELSKISVLYAF